MDMVLSFIAEWEFDNGLFFELTTVDVPITIFLLFVFIESLELLITQIYKLYLKTQNNLRYVFNEFPGMGLCKFKVIWKYRGMCELIFGRL